MSSKNFQQAIILPFSHFHSIPLLYFFRFLIATTGKTNIEKEKRQP